MVIKELLIAIGLDFDEKKLGKVEDKLGSLKQAAVSMVTALAGHALFEHVKEIVGETTAAANELRKTALTFGVEPQQLEAMAAMAGGVDELRTGLTRLSVTADAAANGSKEQAKAFHDLGINVKDAHGKVRPAGELFAEVADKMAKMKNPTERVAAAVGLFGRSGGNLIPMLAQGSEGLKAYSEDLKHLGAEMSEGFLEDSRKYQKELRRQKMATDGLSLAITKAVLPAFQFLAHATAETIGWINRLLSNTRFIETAFVALGAVAVGLGIKMIVPFLPFIATAAAIAALLLLIVAIFDDIWVSIEGGDALIPRLIAKFMAFESTNEVLNAYVITPLKAVIRAIQFLGEVAAAVVMAIQGDFSGLNLLWDEMKAGLTAVAEVIKTAFRAAFDWIWDQLAGLGAGVRDAVAQLPGGSLLLRGISAITGGDSSPAGPASIAPTVSNRGGVQQNVSNEVSISVSTSGGDPNAIGLEVRRHVDEALQVQSEAAFSALIPAVAD